MKVTIRKSRTGAYSAYVAKKDLEVAIVAQERDELWGATVLLENGWRLELPLMPPDTPLPVTVDAHKRGD